MNNDEFSEHNQRMRELKKLREETEKTKIHEGGLLLVHTGNGKGKSSSAFGMAVRSLGWGLKVGIVQYVKGKWMNGEKIFFTKAFPDLLSFEAMGEGFTWDTQDKARDIAAARRAWDRSKELILDESYDFIILDELNIVLRDDTLPLNEVVEFLQNRPPNKHICITGRGARPELIAIADLVTDFQVVKHPYEKGYKAQRGIEF